MEILEHEHKQPLLGQRLKETPPGRERLATTVTAQHRFALQANERAKVRLDPARIACIVDRIGDRHPQLLRRLRLAVTLEDPGLRLDDLRQRPKGDPVTVGKTATLAPGDQLRVGVDAPRQLIHQPALTHTRNSDERDQLRDPFLADAIERIAKDGELAPATDQLGAHIVGDIHAETGARLERFPDRDRIGLILPSTGPASR